MVDLDPLSVQGPRAAVERGGLPRLCQVNGQIVDLVGKAVKEPDRRAIPVPLANDVQIRVFAANGGDGRAVLREEIEYQPLTLVILDIGL